MLHKLEKAFFQVPKGRCVNKFQAYLLHCKHAIHNQAATCDAAESGTSKNLC